MSAAPGMALAFWAVFWETAESDSERALRDLIARVNYKPGWTFSTGSDLWRSGRDARLLIRVQVIDSVSGEPMQVTHRIPAPDFPLDERTLRAWLFEQILLVERHEAMEFFKVDGTAPYFPDHTPGGDPYALVDRSVPGEAGSSTAGTFDGRLPGSPRSAFDSSPPG